MSPQNDEQHKIERKNPDRFGSAQFSPNDCACRGYKASDSLDENPLGTNL